MPHLLLWSDHLDQMLMQNICICKGLHNSIGLYNYLKKNYKLIVINIKIVLVHPNTIHIFVNTVKTGRLFPIRSSNEAYSDALTETTIVITYS